MEGAGKSLLVRHQRGVTCLVGTRLAVQRQMVVCVRKQGM